jgi:DNA polymerase delta subunit 1
MSDENVVMEEEEEEEGGGGVEDVCDEEGDDVVMHETAGEVEVEETFESFAPQASSSPIDDVQVVDIECQLKKCVPEFDDASVAALSEEEGEEGEEEEEEGKKKRFKPFRLVPCMRIYGKLRDGRSICVNTYGYYPTIHLLVSIDPEDIVERIAESLERLYIESETEKLASMTTDKVEKLHKEGKRILSARVVVGFPMYPYVEKPCKFIELKLSKPQYIKAFGDLILDHPTLRGSMSILPYSCIPIVEQFHVDCNLAGWGWFKLKNFRVHESSSSSFGGRGGEEECCRCALEVDANVHDIISSRSSSKEGGDDFIAPTRNLTFDIECATSNGFPTPKKNEVILISCVLTDYVDGAATRKRKLLFQLGSSDTLDKDLIGSSKEGDLHLHFSEEHKLLDSFGLFVRVSDPDFITGHNIWNFDIPYIVERANVLNCSRNVLFLGRRDSWKWYPPRRYVKSRKNGDSREMCSTDIPGRIQLDTMQWFQSNRKERSYGLNYLAGKHLKKHKMDVSPSMITPLWRTSDATRKRLASYGMMDSILTEELVCFKLFDMVRNTIEVSRQTRRCSSVLLKSGMQAYVWGRVLEKAKNPRFDDAENHPVFVPYERPKQRDKDDKFAGAVVLQPLRGFYPGYVVCGDFRSLYPSIIIYLNICFSTFIAHDKYMRLPHNTSPSDANFVSKDVRKGLLAQLEEELMSERDAAKAKFRAEQDPARKEMLNARQNAIKLICNSVYGILSASGGRLVRVPLGLAVTSQGRKMIMAAKAIAEGEQFSGEIDRVIYGGIFLG